MTGDLHSEFHSQAKGKLPADEDMLSKSSDDASKTPKIQTRGRSYQWTRKGNIRPPSGLIKETDRIGHDHSELADSHEITEKGSQKDNPGPLIGLRRADRSGQQLSKAKTDSSLIRHHDQRHSKPVAGSPFSASSSELLGTDERSAIDAASKSEVILGEHATFNLEAVTKKIGIYELGAKRPSLSQEAAKALYEDCQTSEGKREEFLRKFHERLSRIPPANRSDGRQPTTLLEMFGGDKELFSLYLEAIKEEKNSCEFRDAVMTCAAEEQVDGNPCPGQKMVMYIGGPSGAGKSHCRKEFVKKVKEIKEYEASLQEKKEEFEAHSEQKSFVVSIDGGIDRELCQIRQIVLQAALAKGYSGISDLHKNTDTSVKGYLKTAAMVEGKHMHVVIPATFIAEAFQLIPMFSALAKRKDVYQVFAEVRADENDLTGLSQKDAYESFGETTFYNGVSRSYYDEEKEFKMEDLKINNRNIPCESKVYERKYFDLGVQFSRKAKYFFKRFTNPKSGNALVLSNDSDNVHVKREPSGNYVQTSSAPDVKHVTRRELELFHVVGGFSKSPQMSELTMITRLRRFGISEERVKDVAKKIMKGELHYYTDDKGKPSERKKQNVTDLNGFLTFLKQNMARAKLKISIQERW